MQKARRVAGLFVVASKIKRDFTRRTGRPDRCFGAATTKLGKYDVRTCFKTLLLQARCKGIRVFLKYRQLQGNFYTTLANIG
jgi:hypothetical protein